MERSSGKHDARNEMMAGSRERKTGKQKSDRNFRKPDISRNWKSREGRGKVPDFVKNPKKYTKYSLEDVPELSDRANSAAAFDFLKQLKEKNNEESEPAADLSQKMVFSKRVKKDVGEKTINTVEGNSKIDLEDVKMKESKSQKKNKSMQMKLSHLDEEEEDYL